MSRTSPWSPAVETLPRDTFRMVYTARVYPSGNTAGTLVSATGCEVSFDARRTPYVTASLTMPWPAETIRRALDPRRGLAVEIAAGYELIPTSATDVQQLAYLRVDNVTTDYLARTITIEASSDEAVVIGYPAHTAYSYAAGTAKLAAIQAQVAACFPGESQTWDTHGVRLEDFGVTQRLDPGDDRWDAITDWAESMDAKCYHDGLGTWHLVRVTIEPSATLAARLHAGPRGTLEAASVADTRDGWANQAIVIYEHKSGTSAATVTTDTAVATTTLTPPRMAVVTRKRKPENAARAARLALSRALRRGHVVKVSATAYLWVRPRSTVTVDLPGGDHERLLVEAVTFELDRARMNLESHADLDSATPTIT